MSDPRIDADEFDEGTRTLRRWLNRETVATAALVAELEHWLHFWAADGVSGPSDLAARCTELEIALRILADELDRRQHDWRTGWHPHPPYVVAMLTRARRLLSTEEAPR